MKISELRPQTVGNYIRLDEDDILDNKDMLSSVLSASKQYIMSRTGLTADEVDKYEDLTIACLTLCQDMYDTRTMNIPANKAAKNNLVNDILAMHCVNLL